MELRKDYIEDTWVIINDVRRKRPHQLGTSKTDEKPKARTDFFAPGNEKLTPPEIGRIEDGKGGWKMRWFENKFAVVKPEGNPEIRTDNTYFTFSDAYGKHEVIVETPTDKQLWDFEEADIRQLFEIYNNRIEELSKIPGIRYVSVFKNHGEKAGTSLVHSHSQLIAYNSIPTKIRKIIQAVKKYDHDPYEDIINIEKTSYRRILEDDHFFAFCPYASKFNYEVWVFPKRHITKLRDLNEEEEKSISRIMKYLLEKLKILGCSFNYYLNYAPDSEGLEGDFRFHIRICPRIATWAGFEFSTDCIINSVPPEQAARFYRGEE